MTTNEQWLTEYGIADEQHKPYNYLDWKYDGCYIKNNEYLRRDLKQEIIDEGEQYINDNTQYL